MTIPISKLSKLPIALFLGRVSYSIYLWHTLFILVVSITILNCAPKISQSDYVLLLLPLTAILTVTLSALTFALIEKPGMAFGQYLADALEERRGTTNRP